MISKISTLIIFILSCSFKLYSQNINIDNLVPYTDPSAAWSDQNSNVVFTWVKPNESGLQQLTVLAGWAGTTITDSLLNWELYENKKNIPLHFTSRNYRPDKIIEKDSALGINLEVVTSYILRNGICVEFNLTNTSRKPKDVVLTFNYPSKNVKPDWQGPFPVGKIVSFDDQPQGSWATLFTHREHGTNALWVSTFVAGMTKANMELVCLSDLSDKHYSLEPGKTEKQSIILCFGNYLGKAKSIYDECSSLMQKGWTSSNATSNLYSLINKAPSLPAKYKGQEKYERLYIHAITQLNSLYIKGEGGYTNFSCVPWTTKKTLAIAFFWDSFISSIGASEFDTKLAHETVNVFLDNATPRGTLPGTIADSHRAGEGQAPILCWAVWNIYKNHPDKIWLQKIYPGLNSYINSWFKYHASARGLCKYFNAGQIADNDARFDAIQKGGGNLNLNGFESPDLNAFLVMEMKCLSYFAKELNKNEDEIRWKTKSEELGKTIVDVMYFPEDQMFHDVKEGTKEKFSDVKSPNLFLPLWAGVPISKENIKKIIEGHMLNPQEFYREFPFPSLSYDNPKYEPTGYWRGRIWPHIVYWMTQTLWRNGYHKEAEETADRLLTMMLNSKWISENYESKEGKMIGFAEYNWSHSIAILLLLEKYKEPLLP